MKDKIRLSLDKETTKKALQDDGTIHIEGREMRVLNSDMEDGEWNVELDDGKNRVYIQHRMSPKRSLGILKYALKQLRKFKTLVEATK